jgi:hypothetical protein
MKLDDYIKHLQKIQAEHGNMDLVYACDEEGNRFDKVIFGPSVGFFHEGTFIDKEMIDDDIIDFGKDFTHSKPDCVCVN